MAQLSLEQEFQIASFATNVQTLTRAEAIDLLVELHKEFITQQATYQQLLKKSWGIKGFTNGK